MKVEQRGRQESMTMLRFLDLMTGIIKSWKFRKKNRLGWKL